MNNQVCTMKVRSYECDSYGHVNNANYLNYLEAARGEFLEALDIDYNKLTASNYGIYVSEINIKYKSPLFNKDVFTIETNVLEKKIVSGKFSQNLKKEDQIIAEAVVTWVTVNSEGKPVRIPSEILPL